MWFAEKLNFLCSAFTLYKIMWDRLKELELNTAGTDMLN